MSTFETTDSRGDSKMLVVVDLGEEQFEDGDYVDQRAHIREIRPGCGHLASRGAEIEISTDPEN